MPMLMQTFSGQPSLLDRRSKDPIQPKDFLAEENVKFCIGDVFYLYVLLNWRELTVQIQTYVGHELLSNSVTRTLHLHTVHHPQVNPTPNLSTFLLLRQPLTAAFIMVQFSQG